MFVDGTTGLNSSERGAKRYNKTYRLTIWHRIIFSFSVLSFNITKNYFVYTNKITFLMHLFTFISNYLCFKLINSYKYYKLLFIDILIPNVNILITMDILVL